MYESAAIRQAQNGPGVARGIARHPGVHSKPSLHGGVDPNVGVSAADDLDREFEDRLRESSALAVRVAYSVLRQRQDAEDVAQEAFARAYPRFAGLRNPSRFRAWIVRVTWRLAIDRWRSDRRRSLRELNAEPTVAEMDAEELAAGARRAARLWDAIDALPPKLRLAIVLSAIEGHDVREVAELLRVPVGTVKSRLFLARKALAEKLQCLANDSNRR
jgi:RNA polymerase sigma-70 factor (ECF subfamily)